MTGNLLSAISMSMMVGIGAIGVLNAPNYNANYMTCILDYDVFDNQVNGYDDVFIMFPFANNGKRYGYAYKSGITYYDDDGNVDESYFAYVDVGALTWRPSPRNTICDINFYLQHEIANNYEKNQYVYFDTFQIQFTGLPYELVEENAYCYVQGDSNLELTNTIFNEKTMLFTGLTLLTDNENQSIDPYTTLQFNIHLQFSGNVTAYDWSNFNIECLIFADYQKTAQQQAYNVGWQTGYNQGYTDGHTKGYADGYGTALSELSENHTFMSLFNSVADTPLRFIYGLFNFDIFGTSVLVVVMSLLTAIVVFAIVKKVWK